MFKKKPKIIDSIRYFSFGYSQGCFCNADVVYRLRWEGGDYVATVKPLGEPEENSKTLTVPETFARELERILVAHDVWKWNGFRKVDERVLDGNTFQLTIIGANQSRIDAQGYMRWPKGYGEVKTEIKALFETALLSE